MLLGPSWSCLCWIHSKEVFSRNEDVVGEVAPCDATVYPKKYAHGFVVLCFVVVMQSFIMNSHEVFIHIHQGCFAGTGAIDRLPQCQWSKPDGYGKIILCITTTKHSKAKTVCIFLGIYCTTTSEWATVLLPIIASYNRGLTLNQLEARSGWSVRIPKTFSIEWCYSDINKSEICQMRTAHYLKGPLNIGRTTHISSISGPLRDQKCLLISHPVYCIDV